MTTWLRLVAQLLLALLLVAPPVFAAIIPAEALWSLGVSDGDDSGAVDDGTRVVHSLLVTPGTPMLHACPVIASARVRLLDCEIPSSPPGRPSSSRSPPPR